MAGLVMACCLLPLGSFAKEHTACKSTKKGAPKSSHVCAHKPKAARVAKADRKLHGSVAKAAPAAPVAAAVVVTAGLPSEKPRTHGDSACFAALGASKASGNVSAKVPFFLDRELGPEVLANTGHPSKAEKSELASVVAGYEMCLDMAADWRRATYASEVLAVLDAYWSHTKSILGSLQNGKLSFGDAARAVAENDKAYKSKVDGLVAELQPGRTSQVEQRRAAATATQ